MNSNPNLVQDMNGILSLQDQNDKLVRELCYADRQLEYLTPVTQTITTGIMKQEHQPALEHTMPAMYLQFLFQLWEQRGTEMEFPFIKTFSQAPLEPMGCMPFLPWIKLACQ